MNIPSALLLDTHWFSYSLLLLLPRLQPALTSGMAATVVSAKNVPAIACHQNGLTWSVLLHLTNLPFRIGTGEKPVGSKTSTTQDALDAHWKN